MSLCSCAATAQNECEMHGKDALARLIKAQDKEIEELREAQQRHLELIRSMTTESVTPEEAEELRGQIATLMAEVGTLRSTLVLIQGLMDAAANLGWPREDMSEIISKLEEDIGKWKNKKGA